MGTERDDDDDRAVPVPPANYTASSRRTGENSGGLWLVTSFLGCQLVSAGVGERRVTARARGSDAIGACRSIVAGVAGWGGR